MCCARRRIVATAALLASSLAASGCVTGHLFDAGRLQERVARYDAAYSDGEQLHLRYRAVIEDADGEVVERVARGASIALAALQASPALPIDEIRVTRTSAETPCPDRCQRLSFAPERSADASAAPRLASQPPAWLVLEGENGETLSISTGTLSRQHTAGWVYGLLPASLAADAVVTVPLFVLAIPYLFFD